MCKSDKQIILILAISFIVMLIWAVSTAAQTKYVVKTDLQLVEKSYDVLMLQVGVIESGYNSSPKIDEYLKVVGLSKGNPYCASGQYYCYWEANNLLGGRFTLPLAKTGSANKMYDEAQKRGLKVKYEVKKHDLLVWKFPDKYNGHIERVITILLAGNIRTVGFNTGSSNPREGDGVFIKIRNIYSPLGRMKVRGLIGVL